MFHRIATLLSSCQVGAGLVAPLTPPGFGGRPRPMPPGLTDSGSGPSLLAFPYLQLESSLSPGFPPPESTGQALSSPCGRVPLCVSSQGNVHFPKVATKGIGQYLNLRIPDSGTGWQDSSAKPAGQRGGAVKRRGVEPAAVRGVSRGGGREDALCKGLKA